MPWVSAAPVDALGDEGVAAAQVGKIQVALYRAEGEHFASALMCTHGQASLADGYLEDFLIECPFHAGRFDIRTGEAAGAPCFEPIQTYPVKVEDGTIYVQVSDEEA